METEFNLSNKIIQWDGSSLRLEDVKEFIKLLKEYCRINLRYDVINEIDKLAGEKLI